MANIIEYLGWMVGGPLFLVPIRLLKSPVSTNYHIKLINLTKTGQKKQACYLIQHNITFKNSIELSIDIYLK